jgi:peptidoglycan biosynthesis protein MviN/MurJ (putative lipid II flippase)
MRLLGPPYWHDRHPFQEIVRLGAWILPGVVFSNLAVSLPPIWAARFGEGAVSAFGYAYRLHLSAVQLLIMASSTLILAKFSSLVANNNTEQIRKLLKGAALMSLMLGVVVFLVVATAGEYILKILFGGKFNEAAAEQVNANWTLMSLGVGFSLLGNVFAKLFQAQARPKVLSLMSVVGFLTLTASFLLLSDHMNEGAVAAAMVCSSISGVLLGLFILKKSNCNHGK